MPVPVHKVTFLDQSKNGKDRVYFDGKNNWQDAYYVKQGLYMPTVGMTVEAETHAWTPPGKQQPMWYLDKWTEVKQGGAPPATYSNGRDTVIVDAPAKALAGWDIQSGDLSRYASNIVASAITAGLIKEPQDIITWSSAAYRSGECLRHGFSSSISQQQTMPDPNENQDRDPDDPGFTDDNIPF